MIEICHSYQKLPLTLTAPNDIEYYYRKCKNWSKPDYVIDTGPIYTYGVAGRAASQSWLGMGGQEIGVRGVEPPLLMLSVSNEIG